MAQPAVFDSWLSGIGLAPPCRALLADGRESVFDIYEATVVWDEQPRRIPVHEAKCAPLVGMSLLEGYELTVQVRPTGTVTMRPLS